jgi:dihydroflavonol-4-reductase
MRTGKTMNYFVTGATGFIGRHLVRQLAAGGHKVVALVRMPERARDLQELGLELVQGDITDAATLRSAMSGADGAFHLAAWYKVGARDRSLAWRMNVEGTRNVLEAARVAGVPRVVYTSSIAVFGDTGGRVVDERYRMNGPWLSLYDETKWRAHYEVALPMIEAGLSLIILQPGAVYGPGDHSQVGAVLRQYVRRRLAAVPRQGVCWGFVADTARAHIEAMERGRVGESYIVAGPPKMWQEVLDLAHEITGIAPPRFVLHPPVARIASMLMRPLAAVFPVPEMYHPETLRIAAGSTYFADDLKARREIGWDPRPLRDGLEETLAAEMAAPK